MKDCSPKIFNFKIRCFHAQNNLSELHTVDVHPKKGKQELENGEKCKVGQCNEDSEEINADLKYFLNQTTGVYLENNDIGKVINYEIEKSSY